MHEGLSGFLQQVGLFIKLLKLQKVQKDAS